MVGGYVILTKKPLAIGDNDIGAMYGSIQNANNRVGILSSIQKPVLVEYNTIANKATFKASAWFELQGTADNKLTLKSVVGTIVYDLTTGFAVLTLNND